MPFPETLRAMQSFLGSLNFYSRFIENYSIKASCLYVLSDEVLRARQAPSPCIAAFEALKVLYASTPILRHANPALEFHVLLYVTDWAVSATLCQLYEGVLHPVRFCGRKLKGAETRYTRWEKEILALLRVLKVCYYELRNNRLVVYTRYDLLAWLLRDKQNRAERLPWAAILSPWAIRCIQVQSLDAAWNMSALLTHNLASPNDSTLDDLAQFRPHNMLNTMADQLRTDTLPAFPPDYTGHVAAFDGAIKIKEKVGSYGAIIWRLPGWDIVWAHHGMVTEATVNTAEYGGLLCVLRQCIALRLDDVHIFGDSRLVVHQFQGWNQCTKPHLQTLLAETKALTAQLVNPSIHHILRRWNGSADALATRGLQLRSNHDVTDSLSLDRITNVNLLPSLLQPTHEHVASLPPVPESTSATVLGGHIMAVRSGDEKRDEKAISKASSEEAARSTNSTNLPNLHDQDIGAMETVLTKIVNPPNLHDQDIVAMAMKTMNTSPPNPQKLLNHKTTKEISPHIVELPDHITTTHVYKERPVQEMIKMKLETGRQEHRTRLFTCLRQLMKTQARHPLLRNLADDMRPRMGCSGGSCCATEHSTIWTLINLCDNTVSHCATKKRLAEHKIKKKNG